VMRISADGTVLYGNAAAAAMLEQWGAKAGGSAPEAWRQKVREALASTRTLVEETQCGGALLSIVLAPIPEGPCVNLYGRDITEQRRAEEELRKSHDQLESLVVRRTAYLARTVEDLRLTEYRLAEAQRIAHVGNWDWDMVAGTLWWSDEVYRIFGLTPQQFGATYEAFLSYVHPDDRERVTQAVNEAIHGEEAYTIDHRVSRPDGSVCIVHEQAETMHDAAGKAVRMMGTVQDVTELRQKEAALRSLTLELQLAEERESRRIAHELHDSVAQMMAFARRELAHLEKSVPAEAARALAEVGGQLQKAVRQIRTLCFELSPSVLYDLGLMPALEDLAERFATERHIRCRIQGDAAAAAADNAVKVLLYRSVRELLTNVAKHAEASEVVVSVAESDGMAVVTVKDNGRGLEPSALSHRPSRQTGFGLASIRERLTHIGGRMDIVKGRRRGTQITLTAPLRPEGTASRAYPQ